MCVAGGGYRRRFTRSDLMWATVIVGGSLTTGAMVGKVGDPTHVFKILLVLALAGVAFAAIKRPQLAFFPVVTAGCFEQTVHAAGIQTGSSELALIVFAPAFLATWRRGATSRAVGACMALLVLGAFIASMFATDPSQALWGAIRWALVLNGVVAGLAYLRTAGEAGLQRLAVLLSILGGIVATFGWLQMHGHYSFVGPPFGADRPDSTFGYYTNYATFVATAAVVSFGMLMRLWGEHRRRLWILLAVCFALNVEGVLGSISRGAVILLLGGLLTLVAFRVRRPARFLGTAALVALAGYLLYSLVPTEVTLELQQRFTQAQGGDVTRFELQSAGAKLLAAHPTGIGYGNFRGFVSSGIVQADQALAHAHNLYLMAGLDNGWLGMLGFIGLCLIAVTRGCVAGWRSGGAAMQGVFAAALAGFLAQGQYDYFFFETGSLIAFAALLVGALAAGSRPEVADQVQQAGEADREQDVLV